MFAEADSLKKLSKSLFDVVRYLESNTDSIPDYGQRYRTGRRISTGFVESAVNEIVAKRMAKKQQMRWNRYTVQRFLDVRIHVLNGTLEDAFRHWHRGFRPIPSPREGASAAYVATLCMVSLLLRQSWWGEWLSADVVPGCIDVRILRSREGNGAA
jgi:hypothetical protein